MLRFSLLSITLFASIASADVPTQNDVRAAFKQISSDLDRCNEGIAVAGSFTEQRYVVGDMKTHELTPKYHAGFGEFKLWAVPTAHRVDLDISRCDGIWSAYSSAGKTTIYTDANQQISFTNQAQGWKVLRTAGQTYHPDQDLVTDLPAPELLQRIVGHVWPVRFNWGNESQFDWDAIESIDDTTARVKLSFKAGGDLFSRTLILSRLEDRWLPTRVEESVNGLQNHVEGIAWTSMTLSDGYRVMFPADHVVTIWHPTQTDTYVAGAPTILTYHGEYHIDRPDPQTPMKPVTAASMVPKMD